MGRENFYLDELLREGFLWTVFKARCKYTNRVVELIDIVKNDETNEHICSLRKQVEIHRNLENSNIIEMLESFENQNEFCLVTEFPQGKKLSEILKDPKPLPEKDVRLIAKQLVGAVCCLHSNGIGYQGLKPENIFICEGPVVKVCGFASILSFIGISPRNIEENLLYIAPEIWLLQPYQATADLWSLGVILYELVAGHPPFRGETFELRTAILKGQIEYEIMESHFQIFISGLLNKEPKERLNWDQVLEYQFVKDDLEEPEAKEIRAETAASKGYYASLRGETNIPTPAGSSGTCLYDFQDLDSLGFASEKDEGARSIAQDSEKISVILLPLRSWSKGEQVSDRVHDIIISSNKSLRILVNLIAARTISSSGVVNEIAHALLEFRDNIVKMRLPEANGMIAQSYVIIEELSEYYESEIALSYHEQWEETFCDDAIPQLLIDLLSGNRASQESGYPSGLSPVGIEWTVSSICKFVSGRFYTFGSIFIMPENIKVISGLISVTHLEDVKGLKCIGSGVNGVRAIINAVVDLLAFPYSSRPNARGFGDRVPMGEMNIVKANFRKYIEVLVEVEVPATVLDCLNYMDLRDSASRPVVFLAKMTCNKIFAEGLLHINPLGPTRVGRFLNDSCSGEVTSEVLMVVSNLALWSEKFYEDIAGANMLKNLKVFLTHEVSEVRANTCRVLGNMCRHNSFFYTLLAKHDIIGVLIERCTDPDELTRELACFAISHAAYHNDQLYEELRSSIPLLVKLLRSPEEPHIIKKHAAAALDNLVRNSDKLCEDIVLSHFCISVHFSNEKMLDIAR